jgi:hypothetical protein
MGDTQQSQPAGTGATAAEAAAALAEIQKTQEHVIQAALIPAWYWWAMAPPLVAIGASRDSHSALTMAITIPLAVLVMIALTGATVPEVRRRVRVSNSAQPGGRGLAALVGLILLVNAVTITAAVSLIANRVPGAFTISYGVGAAVLVIGGPLLNRYLIRLRLIKARQPITSEPEPAGPWRGVLSSQQGDGGTS